MRVDGQRKGKREKNDPGHGHSLISQVAGSGQSKTNRKNTSLTINTVMIIATIQEIAVRIFSILRIPLSFFSSIMADPLRNPGRQ